ncbi:MAG: restriction endonuclease subunit S [Bacillaceae bacterium]|nr:restriction endonuclease subunit S [Bacillaceae bacterium]
MDKVKQINEFQKTPIGSIPIDWKVNKLENYIKIYSGESPSKVVKDKNGIPYYKVDNLNFSSKYLDQCSFYVNRTKLKRIVPKGSLVFPKRGASIMTNKIRLLKTDSFFDTNLMGLEIINKKLDNLYLYYYISNVGLYKIADTTAVPQLNNKHINPMLIPVPPLKEQQKIADILSTWDRAIELKEKLIDQKKQMKKGLMQKLLTGEVRLPGFDGEWEEVKLGELFEERVETGYENLELLAITSEKGVIKRDELDKKDTSSKDKSNYKRILPGDIGYNTMRMWQGISGVSRLEGIVSPAYTVLKPKAYVDSQFFGYYFKLDKIINFFKRYSQGLVNDTLNLKYSNFKVIKVKVPMNFNEQKNISKIFSTIDKEIFILRNELDKLKLQKKGLMQLLLTGKVRVKV